jgi:MinD superfamily P-loop ATPase containing an inserted ferredoxin domain
MIKGAILYFTLTGNTKLACEYINGNTKNVEFELLNMRDGFPDLSSYEIVGFATFASEFTVAKFVRDYMRDMPPFDKYAFVFTTYGQNNGAATQVLAEEITKKGFKVVLDHGLNTPENYPPVIKRSHGHINQPDEADMKQFNSFIMRLDEICHKIDADSPLETKQVTAKFPHNIMRGVSNRKMMQKIMGDKKIDTNLCIVCGKCAKVCPYGVIHMEGYPVFDESKCYGCFACYNLCPTKAIYTKGFRQFGVYSKPNKILAEKLKIEKD